MPAQVFYEDFAHVADDESRHLRWCLQRLRELGFDYGCMPAHNMLWEGAEKSAGALHSWCSFSELLSAGEIGIF